MRLRGRKVAIFGVFTALALIFSYVELLIPINFGIPGAKLGLANLMTVLVLYKMGIKEALTLSVWASTPTGAALNKSLLASLGFSAKQAGIRVIFRPSASALRAAARDRARQRRLPCCHGRTRRGWSRQ